LLDFTNKGGATRGDREGGSAQEGGHHLSEVRRHHSADMGEGSTTPEDQEAEAIEVVYSRRCEGRMERGS
jgi:hypothetical protein